MSTACKFCGLVGDHLSNCPLWPPAAYPEWLRKAARKGGKKSKRKLSKREARRIASAGWEGAVGEARRAKLRAQTHNDQAERQEERRR